MGRFTSAFFLHHWLSLLVLLQRTLMLFRDIFLSASVRTRAKHSRKQSELKIWESPVYTCTMKWCLFQWAIAHIPSCRSASFLMLRFLQCNIIWFCRACERKLLNFIFVLSCCFNFTYLFHIRTHNSEKNQLFVILLCTVIIFPVDLK